MEPKTQTIKKWLLTPNDKYTVGRFIFTLIEIRLADEHDGKRAYNRCFTRCS